MEYTKRGRFAKPPNPRTQVLPVGFHPSVNVGSHPPISRQLHYETYAPPAFPLLRSLPAQHTQQKEWQQPWKQEWGRTWEQECRQEWERAREKERQQQLVAVNARMYESLASVRMPALSSFADDTSPSLESIHHATLLATKYQALDLLAQCGVRMHTQQHTLCNVYQPLYAHGQKATGWGDFLRGCYFAMQWCGVYKVPFAMYMAHPGLAAWMESPSSIHISPCPLPTSQLVGCPATNWTYQPSSNGHILPATSPPNLADWTTFATYLNHQIQGYMQGQGQLVVPNKEPTKEPTVPCNPPLNELTFAEPRRTLVEKQSESYKEEGPREPTVPCNPPLNELTFAEPRRTLVEKQSESYKEEGPREPRFPSMVCIYTTMYPLQEVWPEPSETDKDTMRQWLQPTPPVWDFVRHHCWEPWHMEPHTYGLVHVRYGDTDLLSTATASTKLNLAFCRTLQHKLSSVVEWSHEHTLPLVLIADNPTLKQWLAIQFPSMHVLTQGDVQHTGEGVQPSTASAFCTWVDFVLMSQATHIWSFSSYAHGSGFSQWTAFTYNIPYQCTFVYKPTVHM